MELACSLYVPLLAFVPIQKFLFLLLGGNKSSVTQLLSEVTLQVSSFVRYEVLTAVKMSMLGSCVVTLSEPVGRYRRFGETYCHEDGGRMFF
jgi:hypothetical protein